MKTLLPIALAATALFSLGLDLHSQAPAVPKTPLQLIEEMKAKNAELLERQTQTLLKLDELEKESGQLKIFGKRT